MNTIIPSVLPRQIDYPRNLVLFTTFINSYMVNKITIQKMPGCCIHLGRFPPTPQMFLVVEFFISLGKKMKNPR